MAPSNAENLSARSTVRQPESISDVLRDDILTGVHRPGQRLIELSLAKRYGVGRAAIRSAIVELDKEGLVAREANCGAAVRELGSDEFDQINEAQAYLEGLLARQAARLGSDEERQQIKRLAAEFRDVTNKNESGQAASLRSNILSHIRLMSRHSVAQDLVVHLRNRATTHSHGIFSSHDHLSETLPQIELVVESIVNGKEDAAEAAMRLFIRSLGQAR